MFARNLNIEFGNKYVFQRKDLPENQDFLSSPKAYYLMNLRLDFDFKIKNESMNASIQADNLLNHTYRDYLNRLRYFANEEGVNIKFALKWSF